MKKGQKSMLALVTITVFMASVLFLPGVIGAGDLEPSGPPGPTMKTLDEIPPTWSQIIPGSERFELVMGGAAVLDKETGLVWERSPDTTKRDWLTAIHHCYGRVISNRQGWRLPTVEELATLSDPTVPFYSNPTLPNGHPFGIGTLHSSEDRHWTATTNANDANYAWIVSFFSGGVGYYVKTKLYYTWCVRCGHGYDAY